MFARRAIQRSVDELSKVFTPEQLRLLVRRLNTPTNVQISGEWEAMVLAATSRVASLKHEHDSGGSSRPDIRAVIEELDFEFVADIVTVSDADMEDDNPVEYFQKEMFAVARALGMTGAGLFLHVERVEDQDRKERRMLALPPKGEIPRFVRLHVRPFLERVAARPAENHRLVHRDELANFRLEYVARERRIAGGGWAVYTNPRSSRHNPIFRGLEQKARQLRRSGFDGFKGIIVCDGGCAGLSGNTDRIVAAFFRQHRHTVSFVVLLDIPESPGNRLLQPRMRSYWNEACDPGMRLLAHESLQRILRQIPPALHASRYARGRSFSPDFRFHNSHEGGFMINSSGSTEVIRVSARAVLQALAGNIRHRPEFAPTADYAIPIRIFQAQINEGRTIKSIRLERSEHDDDDWVVIELDGPDAAVSAFHVSDASEGDSSSK